MLFFFFFFLFLWVGFIYVKVNTSKNKKSPIDVGLKPAEINFKKNEPSFFLWFWESLHHFNVHRAVLIKKKPVSDGREERKTSHMSCAEARRKVKRYWESDPYPAPIESWEQRKKKRSRWETKQMYVHREICKGKEMLTRRRCFFFFSSSLVALWYMTILARWFVLYLHSTRPQESRSVCNAAQAGSVTSPPNISGRCPRFCVFTMHAEAAPLHVKTTRLMCAHQERTPITSTEIFPSPDT